MGHLSCQHNNYEAVRILLHESNQIIDIEGEDSKRRLPEMLTDDKNILNAITEYRNSFDERRKNGLLNHSLQRLFHLFDKNGDNFILPEEWSETQALITEYFGNHSGNNIKEIFTNADKNSDGRIDFAEFKNRYTDMLEALGLSHFDVMHSLCDIECAIFQKRVRRK